MKRWILPFLAAASLAFSTAKAYESRWRYQPVAPATPPPQPSFVNTIAGVGLVEPSSEDIAVGTPVPGLVVSVYVKPGDRVRRGAPLFSLDDRDLRAEKQLRETSLSVTRARLARLEQAPRREEILPIEARVREAEAVLADAQNQQRLIESITDRRAIREEDRLRRREASRIAAARLDEARAALALINAGTWEEDLSVARAEVAHSEAYVHRVQADIERLIVRAPVDGEILQLNVRRGEYAEPARMSKPLLVLGEVHPLHVRVDIDESEAWRVAPGSPAEAVERGSSGRRAPLEFVRFEPYILPKKSLTGDSTERVDTRALQVIYRFKQPRSRFFVGQQMDIYIEASTTGVSQ